MKKKQCFLVAFLFVGFFVSLQAQVDYTARDFVPEYDGRFRPGTNLGYFPPWTDVELANIAAGNPDLGLPGVGVKAIRPALFGSFVETYGYEFRVDVFQHYDDLGLKDNTLIVGFPNEAQRDQTFYCDEYQSEMYANLYEPIWDDGENGTPVNDDNYYALYLYKLIQNYGEFIKFWEIWNEPGFDYTGAKGWLPPGLEGNWWDNDPDPCDYKLRAPIQHYVRTLRISYEVIKTFQPDDYVCVSGTGYPSFLDAIMRNTDNPDGGQVTSKYPYGGGAYFDVMGFHSYPHFDGATREWSRELNDFIWYRHSDGAARGISRTQNIYQQILTNYGYDGTQYPEKEWIITECNIPRKSFSEFLGGNEAQRNFIMKAYMECVRNDIHQLHIYSLSEQKAEAEASFEFDLMGLYKRVNDVEPYDVTLNQEGIAYKTISDLLFDLKYDPEQTAAMQLPFNIDGGAFQDEDGTYMYVLWAKTETDQSEEAEALYTFPNSFGLEAMALRRWDYSESKVSIPVGTSNIELNAAPVFLLERTFNYKQPDCAPANVNFEATNIPNAASWEWEFENGIPASFSGQFPVVSYEEGGNHAVKLVVKDPFGNIITKQDDFIFIEGQPEADFEVDLFGPLVTIVNTSSENSTGYTWDFGDGSTRFEDAEPTYAYFEEGSYVITLTAYNECGASEKEITVTVELPDVTPVTETANESVVPYEGSFRPGSNLGYFPPWTDKELSAIAAGDRTNNVSGVGVKAIRPAMYGSFVEEWGYDFRVPTFEHYKNLGLDDNTMIVGFPSDSLRDKSRYCETAQSEMFANMYTDIWDNGENGTPINDENYYAAYLYNLIQNYGEYVRFWEIWNEPGFDYTGQRGWRQPGDPAGNWWDRDPDPCEYKLRAPIQHYVRLLRISWEVIKTVAPEDYVVVSGTGYLSFLDAVLRNTDNPVDGSSTSAYPLKGGAYFDVMGFHSYPHFDGTTKFYSVQEGGFVYNRHSDAAADGLMRVRNNMQEILSRYGYDGGTYPEKLWTVTECNIPRRNFNDFIGGDVAQRNFTTKAYIAAAVNDFVQLHIFSLAEQKNLEDAGFEFDLMGLYERIREKSIGGEVKTQAGIAYKTTSDILFGTSYEPNRTAALNMPEGVRGAAFRDGMGNYIYALWAETATDNSEEAEVFYSFPTNIESGDLFFKEWDYSETGLQRSTSSQNIRLTAAPIFLSAQNEILNFPLAAFQVEDRIGCPPYTATFNDVSVDARTWEWSFPGGIPSTSNEQNPIVIYEDAGLYDVSLTVSNELGEHTYSFEQYIDVKETQSIDFDIALDGYTLSTTLDSPPIEFTNFYWDFGNGVMFPSYNPSHTYQQNGTYEVKMVPLSFGCPGDTISKTITIAEQPDADFAIMEDESCLRTTATFMNKSTGLPATYQWSFPGAMPAYSTSFAPFVTYQETGTYEVTLVVTNEYGRDTIKQQIVIEEVSPSTTIDRSLCRGESLVVNGTTYDERNPSGTETIPIAGGACDSLVYVRLNFDNVIRNEIRESLCSGESLMVNGVLYDENNPSGEQELVAASGCDSLVIVDLRFDNAVEVNIDQTLCAGGSMVFNGTTYDRENPSGQERVSVPNACDTVYNIMLFFEQTDAATLIEQDLCSGDFLEINGTRYDQSNPNGTEVLTSVNGCDSLVQVNLSFGGSISTDLTRTLCAGSSLMVNGTIYDENNPSGVENIVTTSGCDSIVSVNLSFQESIETRIEETLCPDETRIIGDVEYNFENPSGTQSFMAVNGCDSTVVVDLTFSAPAISSITDVYCAGESVEIAGAVFTAERPSGTRFLTAVNGCDSIINVDLQFQDAVTSNLNLTLCTNDQLEVNGTTYDVSNPSGTEQFTTINGCDSVVNVQLTFEQVFEEFAFYDVCAGESLEINGIVYDRANPTGLQEFTASNGCDSLLHIELEFIETLISTFETRLCFGQSIEINGTVYDEANMTGQEVLESAAGCDSLVNVILTYDDVFEYNLNQTLCMDDFIEVNGTIYNESNPSGTEMFSTAEGCDSLVYVNLDFVSSVEVELAGTLCSDEARVVNGTTYDISNPRGIERIPLANGCDSVVNIDLAFADLIQVTIREELCPGEFYEINGTLFNEANPVGIEIFSNAAGCDSMYIIGLDYPNDNITNIARTLCAGDGFEIDGTFYTESGIYQETLTSRISGCDSIVNLHLNVLEELYAAEVVIEPASENLRGSIFLDIEGGLPPYEVTWSNGANNLDLDNLEAGTYSVIITDEIGCIFTAEYTVPFQEETDEPQPIAVDAFASPNPVGTNSFINLRFDSNRDTDIIVRMIDVSGRLVQEVEYYLPEGRSRQRLRAPKETGVYFFHIILADGEQISFMQLVNAKLFSPNG